MNVKIVLCVIALATVWSGCRKKDKDLVISGKVTDAHTGQVLSGANVQLSKNGLSDGAFNPTFNPVTNVNSGEDGEYVLEFSNQSAGEYRLVTEKSGFLKQTDFLSSEDVLASQPFTHNVAMIPSGVLHIQLTNQQPGSDSDFLSFQLSAYEPLCSCCPIGLMEFNGPVINYESTCTVPADRWQRYVYFYLKNGNSSTQLDSVWVTAGQTTQLSVEF